MASEMRTVEEYEARQTEIRNRIEELDTEFVGQALPEDAREEWNNLNQELESNDLVIEELRARAEQIDRIKGRPQNQEPERVYSSKRNQFATRIPDDPSDFSAYRNLSNNVEDLERAHRDGARKLLETSVRTAHPHVSREEFQNDVDRLIEIDQEIARRVIVTSTQRYKDQFRTYVQTGAVGDELQRAASLTTTAGGFAVPVELDTTLMLTNAGVVNPVRRLARVRQTNVNTVEFINTTGITAGYGAEATEASDNAPTLAQPTVNIEKGFAFVPMSIEIAQDWDGIQEDVAMAFADAKNQTESLKFLKGLGHASQQPQGLIAAGSATAVTSTSSTAIFAVGDLFNLEIALSPRYRNAPTCAIVGNKATFQKVRQFASNGVNIWVQLQGANPPELIGYPAYEWSSYDATPTTSGSTILTIGDFNYFAIVDRAGMNVELVNLLMGASNRFPTGQRGLYMWWRNSTQVLSPTLSANSAFQSLKVL